MVLNNAEIKELIKDSRMIESHDSNSVINSSYKIRIGEIIEPSSGKVITGLYKLRPTKTVLFKSKERIKLPPDITASYSALYSVSSVGVLLINASMIGPGYEGYVSGMLLNFSAQSFTLYPTLEIARLTFFRLKEDETASVNEESIPGDDEYKNILIEKAKTKYHPSFMDIENIANSVSRIVLKKIKGTLLWLGTVVGLIVIFAEIEPFLQGWVLRTTGFVSTHEAMETKLNLYQFNLMKENDSLRTELNKLKSLSNTIAPNDSIKK